MNPLHVTLGIQCFFRTVFLFILRSRLVSVLLTLCSNYKWRRNTFETKVTHSPKSQNIVPHLASTSDFSLKGIEIREPLFEHGSDEDLYRISLTLKDTGTEGSLLSEEVSVTAMEYYGTKGRTLNLLIKTPCQGVSQGFLD